MFLVYIIPIAILGLSIYLYKHKINWLEAIGQLVIPLLFILAFKGCAVMSLTSDVEYWSNPVSKAEYYEAWDEWIEETCSDECCCDSKGENCSTTYYDCSYRRYHDEHWSMTDRSGDSYTISKSEFNRLVKRFGNNKFVDLNRDYDINDGDKYVASWDGTDEDLEICVSKHSYENRPQAASSVFNYPEVSKEDVEQYGLKEYPELYKYQKQDHLIGRADKKIERQLEILNARLGPKKQVKLFIVIFKGQTRNAGQMQEWYWKGGNKNEFIVTIGLDDEDNVQWCYPFSWTEAQISKVNTRTFIEEQEKIDWVKTVDYLYEEMDANFERKQFVEFDYLTVELTTTQKVWMFILTFVFSIILAIIFIGNDFDSEFNGNDWRSKSKRNFVDFNSFIMRHKNKRF